MLVPEEERDRSVGSDSGVRSRLWIEMSRVHGETFTRQLRGRFRAGLLDGDFEPFVRILGDAAVRDGVALVMGDDVNARDPESLRRAQHGGDVVRVEELIEDDRDASEA